MSKSQLKKELQSLTREQLIQLVLDVYDAKRECKEWFEFFLNPQPKELLEKYTKLATKELCRVKRNYMRCRGTVFNRLIKDFASFEPGDTLVLDLQTHIFCNILNLAPHYYYSQAIVNYADKLLIDTLKQAEKCEMAPIFIAQVQPRIHDLRHASDMRSRLLDTLDNAIEFTNPILNHDK